MRKQLSLFFIVSAILLTGCKNSSGEENESFLENETSFFKDSDDFYLYQLYQEMFVERDQEPVGETRDSVIEKYTVEQLENFGIQSEPVHVDSNNKFMIEIYMDENVNSNDFIFAINGVFVYPEYVSNDQGYAKYVVEGEMDWVYSAHEYTELYGYEFVVLEIFDGDYNKYFTDTADYILY